MSDAQTLAKLRDLKLQLIQQKVQCANDVVRHRRGRGGGGDDELRGVLSNWGTQNGNGLYTSPYPSAPPAIEPPQSNTNEDDAPPPAPHRRRRRANRSGGEDEEDGEGGGRTGLADLIQSIALQNLQFQQMMLQNMFLANGFAPGGGGGGGGEMKGFIGVQGVRGSKLGGPQPISTVPSGGGRDVETQRVPSSPPTHATSKHSTAVQTDLSNDKFSDFLSRHLYDDAPAGVTRGVATPLRGGVKGGGAVGPGRVTDRLLTPRPRRRDLAAAPTAPTLPRRTVLRRKLRAGMVAVWVKYHQQNDYVLFISPRILIHERQTRLRPLTTAKRPTRLFKDAKEAWASTIKSEERFKKAVAVVDEVTKVKLDLMPKESGFFGFVRTVADQQVKLTAVVLDLILITIED
ncbi:hypothetical protein HK104_006350, partial [Borealophlyctis nickersoniae]